MSSPGMDLAFVQRLVGGSGGAGQVRLPRRTVLSIGGNDAPSFLHNLCTNAIRPLAVGSGCEAFFTNVQGKVLGHVGCYRHETSIVVETTPNQGDTLLRHLDRYLIREDVQLEDQSPTWQQLFVMGSEVGSILARMGLPFPLQTYDHKVIQRGGATIAVRRVPWVPGEGLLIQCRQDDPRPNSEWTVIQEELTRNGCLEVSAELFEAFRIEQGFPWYGQDITDTNLPQEVQRDSIAISFTKGCYLGQETVARIDALGHVNWHLTRFRLHGTGRVSEGLATPYWADEAVLSSWRQRELHLDGKLVGRLTSVAYAPWEPTIVAMGYVRRELSTSGTRLDVPDGSLEVLGPKTKSACSTFLQ